MSVPVATLYYNYILQYEYYYTCYTTLQAAVEITSHYDSVVCKIHCEVDDIAKVGNPLVDIELEGDDVNITGEFVYVLFISAVNLQSLLKPVIGR